MSSIDDRIVDMEFNNAAFEKGVGTSIKSLQDLNKALDLKDASKGLQDVGNVAKNLDLSAIVNGVEQISSKFNVLGAIGLSVINKLVEALLGFAGTSINAIMDPLIEGGKRRAQNIEQAKFMIKGLGKSWDKLYKDMDYAVAGTAFGIDQAAKAASQLAASGIKAGTAMKASLRGISGVAAMTGSSYDDIANIFTKVAGQGRLMGDDLNRISSRGLNAARALADYFNKTQKGAKFTEKSVRELVTAGKVSFSDFSKALDGAFGAQATKANELYSGSLSNVNAALSRIGEKFAAPVFEKQKGIFNQLRLVINGVARAIEPVVKLWEEMQKSSGKAIVSILKDWEKAIGILSNSPNTDRAKADAALRKSEEAAEKKHQQALNKYRKKGGKKPKKPKILKERDKRQDAERKAEDKQRQAELKAQNKYNKAMDKYKKYGGKKPVKPDILIPKGATQHATQFTASIHAIVNAIRVLRSTFDRVLVPIKEAFAEVFPKKVGGTSVLLALAQAFQKFAYWLQPSNKQLEVFRKGLVILFTVLKLAFNIVGTVFKAIPTIIQIVIGAFNLLLAVIKPLTDFIGQLVTSFLGLFTGVGEGIDVVQEINKALEWLRTNGLGKILEVLANATTAVTEFWAGFGDGSGGNLFEGFNPFEGMLERLKEFGELMSGFFLSAWTWAKGIYKSIKDAMSTFGQGAGGFFNGVKQILKDIGAGVSQVLSDLKGGFTQFFEGFDWTTLLAGLSSGGFIAILVKAFKIFKNFNKILTPLAELREALGNSLLGAIDGFTATMKTMQNELKTKMIVNIALAVGLLAGAFWVLSKVDVAGADTAALAMTGILMEIMAALYIMSKIQSDKGVLKMTGLGIALIFLAASLLIMAKAVQVLSEVDPDRVLSSLTMLTVGLAAMVGALDKLAKDPAKLVAAAFAMGILATALLVMSGAIFILGMMPIEMLIQGGVALAGILLLLTLFAAVPSENVLKAGGAIGILALSLLAMTGAIAILGSMDIEQLKQGGAALALMVLGIVVAVQALKGAGDGAAAMIAMAFALAILIIPIKTFAEMDSDKLAQGIGATIFALIGLVGAANLMQKAVPGAMAMIAMSVAMLILAGAIWVLAQIPGEQLRNTIISIGGALAILLLSALAAQAVAPGLFILAGAVLAMGAAVALAGLGIVLFSMGLATIGVAAQAAIPGLMAFAQACSDMVPHLMAMAGLALVLGALALAVGGLGVAFILLGVGLIAVGAGMALLAAFGGMGAIAMLAVWKALEPLVWEALKIAALGGALLALGAGLALTGAGLILLGAGLIVAAIGLLAFVGSSFAAIAMIDGLRMAFERFTPIVPTLPILAMAINLFGQAVLLLKTSLQGVDAAMRNAQSGFGSFGASVEKAKSGFEALPSAISRMNNMVQMQLTLLMTIFQLAAISLGASTKSLGSEVQNGSVILQQALSKMLSDIGSFAGGVAASTPKIRESISTMFANTRATLNRQLSNLGTTMRTQGGNVGKDIVDGMVTSINNGTSRAVTAAKNMAAAMIKGIKQEFEIASPSKVMKKIGEYVKEGFYKGLTGFEDEPLHRVQEAVKTMKEEIKEASKTAEEEISALNKKINKLNKKKKKSSKDKTALKNAKKEREDLRDIVKKSEAATKKLDGALKKTEQQLMKISDQYDEVVKNLEKAETALEDAQKAMVDAQKSYTDQFSKLPEFAEEGDLVNTYLDDLEKQIAATKKFAQDLAYIRKLGLDDKMYAKLLEKGTDAQPFIDALIESGQSGVDEINKLQKELDDAASALGETAAKEMHEAGIAIAQGLVNELKKEEGALKAQMEALGKAMVTAMKKELGIKSPSRVFGEIGGYTIIGLMEGMQKHIPALEHLSEDVGDTAIDGLRKAIDEIGESVYGEMDMTPTIRPVLDLSDVENAAKGLGNIFGSKSIDVGSTYADASNIALSTRARELLAEQERGAAMASTESVAFYQYNSSPKALSPVEIYRQTRNQLSGIKRGLPK